MSIAVRAAVTVAANDPVRIEDLFLDDPGPGEVLVQLGASGICHTDFLAPRIVPLPAVFGHEGAGRVLAVGDGVTAVQPGDRVVGSYGCCGACSQCLSGETYHCADFSTLQLGARRAGAPALHRPDGTPVSGAFFEQSSFATHALMTERNVVQVADGVPDEFLAPLGCGVLTGFGAVSRVFAPQPGQSLVVFGAGGVGLAAIMAARLAGCDPIIAVDILPARLEMAREFGASHALDGRAAGLDDQIRRVSRGGVDFSLETVGQAETFNRAVVAPRTGGTCGIVALPNIGGAFEITSGRPLLKLNLIGIIEGRSRPQDLIPTLVELIASGDLPMARYTTVFDFEEVNAALAAGRSGKVAKPVLRISG